MVDDTRTEQATYDHECYFEENTGGRPMAYTMAASLKSWDADGFTLTWSGFSLAPAQVGYLVLGDAPLAVGGIAEAPDGVLATDNESGVPYHVLLGITAIGAVGVVAGGWYVRQRRVR